jgi:hypothetical protein
LIIFVFGVTKTQFSLYFSVNQTRILRLKATAFSNCFILQLASDNTIDIAAVKAKFVASAGEQWKTTVETQVDTCWAELNSNIK